MSGRPVTELLAPVAGSLRNCHALLKYGTRALAATAWNLGTKYLYFLLLSQDEDAEVTSSKRHFYYSWGLGLQHYNTGTTTRTVAKPPTNCLGAQRIYKIYLIVQRVGSLLRLGGLGCNAVAGLG
eukprot:582177-Prorocentrum_minimum.AAC.2